MKREYRKGKCYTCPKGYKPNSNQTDCIDLYAPITYNFKSLESVFCLFLSFIGCCLSIFVIYIFLREKKTPISKSSDLEMTISHLIIFCLIFVAVPVSFLSEPSPNQCLASVITVPSLFVLVIALMFARSEKLIMAFSKTTRVRRRDLRITAFKQFFTVFIALSIEATISATIAEFMPIDIKITQNKETFERTLSCDLGYQLIIQLCYIGTMLIVFVLQAYRGRKIPDSMKETGFILTSCFTVLGTFVFLFLSFYSQNNGNHERSIVVIFLNLSCFSLFISMYGSKVFIMLFRKELNTREAFQKYVMERIKRNISIAEQKRLEDKNR